MKINEWLKRAENKLKKATVPSARLDAEVFLADQLKVDRMWLVAHDGTRLSKEDQAVLAKKLERRAKGEPLAYIRGWVEFYGRKFTVTPDVLIPRPETEALIDLTRNILNNNIDDSDSHLISKENSTATGNVRVEPWKLVDVGTGSGCIAVTLKLEHPELEVYASDISPEALKIARKNAKNLGAKVTFLEADLLHNNQSPTPIPLILANLPYVDTTWETRGIDYEPPVALYARKNGLELIFKLIIQASQQQIKNAWLILEADPRQHDEIIAHAHKHGYSWSYTEDYALALQKS